MKDCNFQIIHMERILYPIDIERSSKPSPWFDIIN